MTATMVITGASRGLGAATAIAAARQGCNLVLNARTEEALLDVQQQCEAQGARALVISGDISQPSVCNALVQKAVHAYGGVDSLVNNASLIKPIQRVEDADAEGWGRLLAVNVLGSVMLTKEAIPYLRRTKGCVINVSSGAAVNVIQGWGAYCLSKASINHFTRLLADEESAITSIAFRPGVVDTQMQAQIRAGGEQGMTKESHDRFLRLHHENELLPPDKPGTALVMLALYADPAWSGDFIAWDEARVQTLVQTHHAAGD